MKTKKKLSPLWLIPAVVIVAMILWCIHFPLTMFMGLDKGAEFSSAGMAIYKVDAKAEIQFSTNDPQRLAEIVEELRTVRCRFMGWSNAMYYDSEEKPQLVLHIAGYESDTPFNVGIWVNGKNDVIVTDGNILLRAKDSGLYDYLTELVASSEDATALNDGWNYTPNTNAVETIKSAILGEGEKSYCNSIVLHNAEIDWDAREWAIKQYTDYKDGWTEEYLQENMMAVSALYTVEYDGRKTFLPSGKMERVFFLFFNPDIQKWEIWENTTATPVEDGEAQEPPPAVPEIVVDPALYEQAQTEQFSYGDTLSVQVTNVIKTETRILPAEDNFEYEVYTVLPGAEIEVIKAAMSETSDQGLVGDWVLYDIIGNYTFIVPYMENIPITETTRGIGSESVCVLVFELYTGEK